MIPVQRGCLSIHNCLEEHGHGLMQLCASHVDILHTISGICCDTDYIVVGFLRSWFIIWFFSFALHLLCIGMSPSIISFSLSFARYALVYSCKMCLVNMLLSFFMFVVLSGFKHFFYYDSLL